MEEKGEKAMQRDSFGRFLPICRPAQIRTFSSQESGWIAGLIDGEGSLYTTSYHRGNHTYEYWSLQVVNTNKPLLERLHEVMGNGSMKLWKQLRGPQKKPLYTWETRNRHDIAKVISQIKDLLIVKKERGEQFLTWYDKKEGMGR